MFIRLTHLGSRTKPRVNYLYQDLPGFWKTSVLVVGMLSYLKRTSALGQRYNPTFNPSFALSVHRELQNRPRFQMDFITAHSLF